MLKSIKIRIYPDSVQKEFISKQLGCCRLIYNKLLYYYDTSSRPERYACFSIPKDDFEKEYVEVDIDLLINIINNKKEQYCDNDIVKTCLDDILKLVKNN